MELKELSDKWDKYAEAQEAHRKAVDERIVKLEKGESADVEAKLAKSERGDGAAREGSQGTHAQGAAPRRLQREGRSGEKPS
jgi:hypothetical protein